jgi:hypothetical protein
MVTKPVPYLVITRDEARWLGGNEVLEVVIEECPVRYWLPSEGSVEELLDRVRGGGVIIAKPIKALPRDPLGEGYAEDYAVLHSRPVAMWLGWVKPTKAPLRLGGLERPCWLGGLRCRACFGNALLINRVLEGLGLGVRITHAGDGE